MYAYSLSEKSTNSSLFLEVQPQTSTLLQLDERRSVIDARAEATARSISYGRRRPNASRSVGRLPKAAFLHASANDTDGRVGQRRSYSTQ